MIATLRWPSSPGNLVLLALVLGHRSEQPEIEARLGVDTGIANGSSG